MNSFLKLLNSGEPKNSLKTEKLLLISGIFLVTIDLSFYVCVDSVCTGGVRHGPQRVMGKNITDVHYTRDTME